MTTLQTLRDLMTSHPVVLDADATVADAAKAMKARDVGDVLVERDGRLCGIVTDRDLVVRCLADDPKRAASKRLGEVCSQQIHSLAPDAEVGEAIQLMQERAIRRIPVVEDGSAVGIVSLGDLAIARDRQSCLGQISAAPPSR
jgi:CBS domain-containing protein